MPGRVIVGDIRLISTVCRHHDPFDGTDVIDIFYLQTAGSISFASYRPERSSFRAVHLYKGKRTATRMDVGPDRVHHARLRATNCAIVESGRPRTLSRRH